MKISKTFLVLGLGALFVLAGCASSSWKMDKGTPSTTVENPSSSRGNSPPPHAPAHGYRHKHRDGLEMSYDSSLKLYVVSGHPESYYSDGWYYRYRDGAWQFSVTFDDGWKAANANQLPKVLKGKHEDKSDGKANSKGNKSSK